MQTPFQKPQPRPVAQPSSPDTVPAKLTPGEGVLTKEAVAWYGLEKLQKMESAAKEGMAQMQKQGRVGGKPVPQQPPQGQPRPPQQRPMGKPQQPPQQGQGQPRPPQQPQMGKPQGQPTPPAQMAQQQQPMMKVPQPVRAFNQGGVVTQGGYYPEAVYQPGSINIAKTYVPSAVKEVEKQQQEGSASSAGQSTVGTGTSGSKTVGTGTSSSTTKGPGTQDLNSGENEMRAGTNRGSPGGAGQAGGTTQTLGVGSVEGGEFGKSVGEMIDRGNIEGLVDTATAPDALVDVMDMVANAALSPGLPGKVAGFMDTKGQLRDLATKDRQKARDYLSTIATAGPEVKGEIAQSMADAAQKSFEALSETSQAHGGAPPGSVGNVIGGYNTTNPFSGNIESYSSDGSYQVGGPVPSLGTKAAVDYFGNLTDQQVEAALDFRGEYEKDFMDKEKEDLDDEEIGFDAFGNTKEDRDVQAEAGSNAASGDFGGYGGNESDSDDADGSGQASADNDTPD